MISSTIIVTFIGSFFVGFLIGYLLGLGYEGTDYVSEDEVWEKTKRKTNTKK